MLHNEITEQNKVIIDYQTPVSTRKAYCSVCEYLQQKHLCMNISNIKPSAFDTYWGHTFEDAHRLETIEQ